MNIANRLSPNAADMIRMDHTRVLAVFHRYHVDSTASVKQGLVSAACLALEIHAAIEEEIFYPALRDADNQLVEKSIPEHEEMRRLIAILRSSGPTSPEYDSTFMNLMRNVIHHVADEETVMLPAAERLLSHRLSELGASMAKRRIELMAPRIRDMAFNTARSRPGAVALAAAGALMAVYAIARAVKPRGFRPFR
jgi:hemerythrin-like domain-containing protein